MKLKYELIPAIVLSIALSGTAIAKKPEGKGNPHSNGPDARWENSNKQSDEYSRRGQERAEERHRAKESDKHKYKNKGKDKKYKHKKEKYHDDDKYNKKHGKYDRGQKDKDYDRDDRYKRKHDRSEQKRDTDRYDRRDKDDRGDDRYEGKHDRYERQRNKERYQNNPVDTIIDRNVDDAKSIIDNTHRRTIDSIDNKSRELMGAESGRDRTQSARPWWSIFGNE